MRTADFFAFARARHAVTLRRAAGLPEAEWLSEDPILRTYRFTNVFRELDRTTVWFRQNVRDRLASMTPEQQLLGTILFRTFNRIESMDVLFNQTHLMLDSPVGWGYLADGDYHTKSDIANTLRKTMPKGPWVTGAYIVKTPDGMDKLDGALWIVEEARKRVAATVAALGPVPTLQGLHSALQAYPYLGGFTAYEVVSDLRWLPILSGAPDIMSWAHAGPGAVRGLNRLLGRDVKASMKQSEALQLMQQVLRASHDGQMWPNLITHGSQWTDWPCWEMREVEHTLCEFDKYERVRLGEGKPRGRFR